MLVTLTYEKEHIETWIETGWTGEGGCKPQDYFKQEDLREDNAMKIALLAKIRKIKNKGPSQGGPKKENSRKNKNNGPSQGGPKKENSRKNKNNGPSQGGPKKENSPAEKREKLAKAAEERIRRGNGS